jgi:hypothetical protein
MEMGDNGLTLSSPARSIWTVGWGVESCIQMRGGRQRGIIAHRGDVDVRDLAAWCEQRGRPLDGDARSTYTAETLKIK